MVGLVEQDVVPQPKDVSGRRHSVIHRDWISTIQSWPPV